MFLSSCRVSACVSGLSNTIQHITLSENSNDPPVDGCGFLPVCRDSSQPHPVHTLYISTEMAFGFQLENMELLIPILEQMLLCNDHGPYCSFY